MLDRDGSRWRDNQVHHRVMAERREVGIDNLAIVADRDDLCFEIDKAQLGENCPFDVEIAVSLPEADSVCADRRASRNHESDRLSRSQLCQAHWPGIAFDTIQSRRVSAMFSRNQPGVDV